MNHFISASSLCLLFLVSGPISSLEVFVSKAGSEGRVGGATVTTVEQGLELLKNAAPGEGRVLTIEEGFYFLPKTLLINMGTEEGQGSLLIRGKGLVTISGGEQRTFGVEQTKTASSRLWVAQRSRGPVSALFVDGRRVPLARFPTDGSFLKAQNVVEITLPGNPFGGSGTKQSVSFLDSPPFRDLPAAELSAEAFLNVFHHWDFTRRKIVEHREGLRLVSTVGSKMKAWNPWKKDSFFYIDNAFDRPMKPGTWTFEKEAFFYYPNENETPIRDKYIVPETEILVRVGTTKKRVSNVVFQDLTFAYSKGPDAESGYDPYQAAVKWPSAILLENTENIQFKRCRFISTGGYAISVDRSSSLARVDACVFSDLGAGGIKIGDPSTSQASAPQGGHHSVLNSLFENGGKANPCGVAIWIGNSGDNLVQGNEIRRFGYSGISVGWIWGFRSSLALRNKISGNYVHDIGGAGLSDLAGIYTLGPSLGTKIEGNLIERVVGSAYGGWGLFFDEGSSGIVASNNWVEDTSSGSFHLNYGRNNQIEDNVFVHGGAHEIKVSDPSRSSEVHFQRNHLLTTASVVFDGPWPSVRGFLSNENNFSLSDPLAFVWSRDSMIEWRKKGFDRESLVLSGTNATQETKRLLDQKKKLISGILLWN